MQSQGSVYLEKAYRFTIGTKTYYIETEELGSGAFGIVYKAYTDIQKSSTVAIKNLRNIKMM